MSAADADVDLSVDVLVIGAGGCGLVAALAAQEAGADVALVEKLPRLAGNTMLSSGSIPAAGTRFQALAGIADDPARFAADLRRTAGPHQAEALVDRLAAVSAPMVEWLADSLGLPIELIGAYRHVGHSVNRLHAVPTRRGSDMMQGLWAAAEARGIPIALASPATRLLGDGNGPVTGAVVRTQGAEETRIAAKAVILASNGFGQNKALLRRFAPDIAEADYFGSQGSDGEAIAWGLERGARLANMGAYQAHAGIAQPHGELVTWTVIEKGGLILDESGCRFADETLGYSAFAAPALRRGGRLFAVYDTRIRSQTAAGQPDFGVLVHHGGAPDFADASSLARACGMPAEVVRQTLSEAADAAAGQGDAFGRRHWGLGALQAPFVATRIAPALFHTQGGLLVDGEARVLREDGHVVPGLYAGGGAAAGISGQAGGAGYASGNGLLAALGLGYIAGRAAARHATGA